jgi:aminoglycoside 6'-N-acetyltransferase
LAHRPTRHDQVVAASAEPTLHGAHVTLRPMREGDVDDLRRLHGAPEVTRWWGPIEDDFPLDDDPEATRFCIVLDGETVGMIQYGEEPEEDFRHAWIDIFVAPERHGRGIGTDAIRTLVEHLLTDRGHHRVTIDPAADNAAAVRCYEKAGFRRVGVMESSWRDAHTGEWIDSILMELVRLPPRR